MLNGVCNTPYLEELPEGDPAWAQLDGDTSLFYEQEKPRLEFKSEPYFEEDYGQLINDEQLLDLAKTAEETGNLLPLIKEELKCKIQAKRLAAGQEELNIQEPKPKANQLTEDDIQRRETRKAQNRRAAQRYRVKQRRLMTTDKQEKQRLELENASLLAQVRQLQADKQRLLAILEDHKRNCCSPREAVVPDWDFDPFFFLK